MKKIMILALSLITVGLFAAGNPEAPMNGQGPDAQQRFERPQWVEGASMSHEALELSGTIEFGIEAFPVLVSGGENYDLMVPPFIYDALDITDGTSVTLQGFVIQGDDGKGDRFQAFRPVSGTINGEEIDLEALAAEMPRGRGHRAFGGPMGGPMDGAGRTMGNGQRGGGPRGQGPYNPR